MKILVTAGPSTEQIDKVRRITNFSTGQLGIQLSNALAEYGHQVTCFMGQSRTCTDEMDPRVETRFFTSVENLKSKLEVFSQENEADVVLHAAALADYSVAEILDSKKKPLKNPKISSRENQEIFIRCISSPKLITLLRTLFPHAEIIGWKYEKEGTQEEGIQKAFQQIEENKTSACVLNGDIVGEGFIFCENNKTSELKNREELIQFLIKWIGQKSGVKI